MEFACSHCVRVGSYLQLIEYFFKIASCLVLKKEEQIFVHFLFLFDRFAITVKELRTLLLLYIHFDQ